MKKCSEINELMSMYIDNELDSIQRSEFEKHIENCDPCKKELENIMYIVNLCSDIEEQDLPENFKVQLHEKLVQVKLEEENKNKTAFLKSRYIRILAATAACLAVVVLLRGFFANGYFTPGKFDLAAKSSETAEAPQMKMARQADAASEEKAKAAETEANTTMAAEAPQVEMAAGAPQASMEVEAPTESDRGPDVTRKELEPTTSYEALNTRNVNLTVSADNPEQQVENINSLAIENQAEAEVGSRGFALMQAADENGKAEKAQKVEIVLNFKIPNVRFDSFKKALEEKFGSANVQVTGENIIDLTENINSLYKVYNDLDNRVKEMEGSQKVSNPDEMNSLKENKEEIMEEITRTEDEKAYTTVSVTVIKK